MASELKWRGIAWIGQAKSSAQEPWRFTLTASAPPVRAGVDWAGLLPDAERSGWLTADPDGKALRIDLRKTSDDCC